MSDCGVCLSSEYEITCEFFHEKIVTARKPHKCYECSKEIKPGEQYQRAGGKCDGYLWNANTCLICAEIRRAFYCDGPEIWGEFWIQMADYAFESMTTGCFDRLKTAAAKAELLRRWYEWKFDRDNV